MNNQSQHNDSNPKLADTLRQPALTTAERTTMRTALLNKIREETHAIERKKQEYHPRWGIPAILLSRPAIAVVAAFVLVGGGTSLAAERALPGDLLYPVKLSFNERAREKLISTDAERLAWQIERINRRFLEAEQLTVRSQLTDERRVVVEQALTSQLATVESRIRNLTERGNLPSAAATVSSLEATLKAHSTVLKRLQQNDATSTTETLISNLSTMTSGATATRVAIEEKIRTIGTAPSLKVPAEAGVKRAETLTSRAEKLVGVMAPTMNPARPKIIPPTSAILESKDKLARGEYGEAIVKANEAIREATEQSVATEASTRLGLPTVTPAPAPEDFAACVAAGHTITAGPPRTCRTPDGKIFAETKPAQETPTNDTLSKPATIPNSSEQTAEPSQTVPFSQ